MGLESQVYQLNMMCNEIHYTSEEVVANNMYISKHNYEVSKELDSSRTKIENLSAEISGVVP